MAFIAIKRWTGPEGTVAVIMNDNNNRIVRLEYNIIPGKQVRYEVYATPALVGIGPPLFEWTAVGEGSQNIAGNHTAILTDYGDFTDWNVPYGYIQWVEDIP